jgi:hypothetical protein
MNKKWWLIALILCLALATLSPLASSAPDGLEKVAGDKGFVGLAQESPFEVVAGYLFPGIENQALATILAGWLGTLGLFGIAYGLAWLIRIKKEGNRLTKTEG